MNDAISSLTLMRVPAILEAHSVPPLEFLSRAGLSPNLFLKGKCWLPRSLCFSLVETATLMTGNSFFGAEVGAAIRFPDLGSYGEQITAASTLEEALGIAQRELRLVHGGAVIRGEIRAGNAMFHFHFTGDLAADPLQYELGSLAVMRSVALLTGEADRIRVHTTLPWSRSANALEEHLGWKLEFGQSSNAVVIDRELLQSPVARSRKKYLQPELALIMQTAQSITALLPEGTATLENIARRLNLNERTLQRKLAKFGIKFEELLDITRRDEAVRLLREGREPLADIAFQLGYSNQANFNRAFHRWTGNAPMAYRQRTI